MSGGPSKPVIGILGGVGAGKSTVAAALGRLGCRVIDADAIGHQMLDDPAVRDELAAALGEGVVDTKGNIDRPAVAKTVFNNPEALAALNAVMHPRMRLRIEELLAAAGADECAKGVVLDAAIMVEAGWNDLCTAMLFVESDPQTRSARAQASRGWDRKMWQRREDSQISLDRKRSMCQYSVYNCSDVSDLEQQVREVFTRITHAKGPS
ncbi:MAG: dephospho-CoA kinase [Planctomycetaceae bacterium]|nr:dephospho-CoA kinase [Planctomycetaceae bacterium]